MSGVYSSNGSFEKRLKGTQETVRGSGWGKRMAITSNCDCDAFLPANEDW